MSGIPLLRGRAPRVRVSPLFASPFFVLALVALCTCGCGGGPSTGAGSPYAVRVVDFMPGARAGFGQDRMPGVVLGPPHGGGTATGSTDVVSLGDGGTITLELGTDVVDGPGTDLLVFENAFFPSGSTNPYVEPGFVSLSEDGTTFVEHPCEFAAAPNYPGCAGVHPVLANPDENMLDPTDPAQAGGDPFDLADFGLTRARYVRIRDAGTGRSFGTDDHGFDLDAVAVVHGG